jgi:hypothetical protein
MRDDTPELEARHNNVDNIYAARRVRDRPRPAIELGPLLGLASAAVADPARLVEWSLAATPENVTAAVLAADWDRRYPWHLCWICYDGKKLTNDYICRRCDGS